ncbi:hypothetical protein Tcur_4860 [Thermomonospora curvata DSM 43183]|uniref:Uncharacterized protein n=1 Tax=Thermomonospora curvata (strain ATCC 19995 / DSM 43183 / JCM 3096 / KCTC 9072 / NBRC 15933 / NCIMB 10081 / Henssen B9) TaxID=471852 RepID=D1A863_THECD|nr:hypothetical protein Tcur_4860 [Thermomonospora curvata DSM 43183]
MLSDAPSYAGPHGTVEAVKHHHDGAMPNTTAGLREGLAAAHAPTSPKLTMARRNLPC